MKWIILIGIAGGLAMGCGTRSSNPGNETLSGTRWRLTAWSVSSLEAANYSITADFGASDISGFAAVNNYGGPCLITRGGGISIGQLQSTLMAGADDAMRAESLYFELLAQVRGYSVTDTTLTMMDEGNHEVLIFEKR